MASNVKRILAQKLLDGTGDHDVYTVGNSPVPLQAALSSVVFCNITGSPATVTMRVCAAGAVNDNKQFILHAANVPANDNLIVQLGITLAATDVIRIAGGTDSAVCVSLFGIEEAA